MKSTCLPYAFSTAVQLCSCRPLHTSIVDQTRGTLSWSPFMCIQETLALVGRTPRHAVMATLRSSLSKKPGSDIACGVMLVLRQRCLQLFYPLILCKAVLPNTFGRKASVGGYRHAYCCYCCIRAVCCCTKTAHLQRADLRQKTSFRAGFIFDSIRVFKCQP